MARTNVLETAKRIRRQISSSFRPVQIVLPSALNSTDATFIVGTIPAGLQVGSLLGIDLELMFVASRDTAAGTVTVIRGYLDSDPVSHAAQSLIDVDARFTLIDTVEAMRTELMSWGPQLYYTDADTFPVNTSAVTFELPAIWANTVGIVDLRQVNTDMTETTWPRLGATLVRGTAATFDGAPTSGMLLRFHEPIRTGQLYITAALPYEVFTLDTTLDFITDYHLAPGMVEVVELGAKKRLVADGEYERVVRQPLEANRFQENTLLQTVTSMLQMFDQQYRMRKQEEVNKINRRWPLRMA